MEHIRKMYEKAFTQHGDSPNAVLWPKGRQDIRFQALTKNIPEKGGFSVIDYGCGLAHMKEYLDYHYEEVSYVGADMLKIFINASKAKYPEASFCHVRSPEDISECCDYVFSSGVFNTLYTTDPEEHRDIVFNILRGLFERTNNFLSVNFISDAVDFQQENSYHQNVTELYQYIFNNLSRRLLVDCSYMPYEFTVTVWKDQHICRPENIYGS